MAIPDSKRLRQLVSDYYHGLVTSDSYREQRAFLLDNIGKHVEPEQDMTAPRPQTRATVAKADIPVRPANDDESASSGSKTAIIGVVVVAIVLVGAYLVLDPFAGPDSTPGESDVAAEGGGPGPGDVLIEEFLAQNDWRQDSLGNFALAWEAMEAPQRNEATGGRQYRRLTTVLHRRIREHLALDGSADNNELASLMELAATIGAPYERAQTPVPGPRDPVQSVGDEAETVEDAPVVTAEPAVTEEPGKMREAEQAKPANVESDVRAEAENEDFSPVVEEEMSAGESESIEIDDPCPADLASTRRPYCRDVIQSGGTGPDMVVLPMGSFGMGSDVSAEESPAHNVDIAYHIAVSAYEITAGVFA